jgi:hypothetical protein
VKASNGVWTLTIGRPCTAHCTLATVTVRIINALTPCLNPAKMGWVWTNGLIDGIFDHVLKLPRMIISFIRCGRRDFKSHGDGQKDRMRLFHGISMPQTDHDWKPVRQRGFDDFATFARQSHIVRCKNLTGTLNSRVPVTFLQGSALSRCDCQDFGQPG